MNRSVGDCNGDGQATVNELLMLVSIALGDARPSACSRGFPSGSAVDIATILRAANDALNGCGTDGSVGRKDRLQIANCMEV